MTQIGTTISTLSPPSTSSSEVAPGAPDRADSQSDASSFLRSLSSNANSNAGTTGGAPPSASATGARNAPSAGSTSNGQMGALPSKTSPNPSTAGATSIGHAAPANGGKKTPSSQTGSAQNKPVPNHSATSSSATAPAPATGQSDPTTPQFDTAQLQIADGGGSRNVASSESGSQNATSSPTLPIAPAALAQLLRSGTDSAPKADGSAAAAEAKQPVVPPTGLVDVLTRTSRQSQDASANKSPSGSDQPGSGNGTQTSSTKQGATGSSATTLLDLTGAAAGASVDQAAVAKGSGQETSAQRNLSPVSVKLTNPIGTNLSAVEAVNASVDQIAALQTAVLDGQLAADKAINPTVAVAPSATSLNTQLVESANSSVVKASDKSNLSNASSSASDHVESATLAAASPSSMGVSAPSQFVAHATGPLSSQSMQSAQEMANRVAETLRTAFEGGGSLRVRLEPPALGRVQIEVQSESGAVSARLEVQTPAARQTLLDNISLLHDAIGQTGASVGRIEIEVVPQQQHDSNGSDPRDANSGGQQQDSGANSQGRSSDPGGSGRQQNPGGRRTAALDEIDIEV
jgi:flagellar hook-length control protein FliK